MGLTIEGIIAIISISSISIIGILKIISIVCYQSKCSKIKCCCLEVQRDTAHEAPALTFDNDNNISHQPSTIQHPQDIHISIDRSPQIQPRTLEEIK